MSDFASNWYIVSQEAGGCLIVTAQELAAYGADEEEEEGDSPTIECWGPFENQEEAIAKRTSLIQSGRCKPK
jgi:hypothetical protein